MKKIIADEGGRWFIIFWLKWEIECRCTFKENKNIESSSKNFFSAERSNYNKNQYHQKIFQTWETCL